MTPEGKVKAMVNKAIAAHVGVYKFMPVPGGYGPSSLDFILCAGGKFCAVETKKPWGKTTPRQDFTITSIRAAGGAVFVIDGVNGELEHFKEWLQHVCPT